MGQRNVTYFHVVVDGSGPWVAIAPKGRDSLLVTLRSNRTGIEMQRSTRKGTLIAAFWPTMAKGELR